MNWVIKADITYHTNTQNIFIMCDILKALRGNCFVCLLPAFNQHVQSYDTCAGHMISTPVRLLFSVYFCTLVHRCSLRTVLMVHYSILDLSFCVLCIFSVP